MNRAIGQPVKHGPFFFSNRNVALASDHTIIKGVDAKGNIVVVREMGVLRMFVKEKGKWRVAGAGLVPIVSQ